ncbi:unnamed protein product [Sphagnum balticum]
MRQACLLRLGGCMQRHRRKSSGEEEEGDPCSSQADVHISGGRYLYEHLQKKLPFSPPTSQPNSLCVSVRRTTT